MLLLLFFPFLPLFQNVCIAKLCVFVIGGVLLMLENGICFDECELKCRWSDSLYCCNGRYTIYMVYPNQIFQRPHKTTVIAHCSYDSTVRQSNIQLEIFFLCMCVCVCFFHCSVKEWARVLCSRCIFCMCTTRIQIANIFVWINFVTIYE